MGKCPTCGHVSRPKKAKGPTVQVNVLAMGEVHAGQLCHNCDRPIEGMCWAAKDFPAVFCAFCVPVGAALPGDETQVNRVTLIRSVVEGWKLEPLPLELEVSVA